VSSIHTVTDCAQADPARCLASTFTQPAEARCYIEV
jgi:hypothetical protein